MTSKDELYTFLKSAKAKRCGGLSGISHLTKNEMSDMAYALGFSSIDNRRKVYTASNDPSLKKDVIQIKGRKKTKKTQATRPKQEEKKQEETWEDIKKRGLKMRSDSQKILDEINENAERTGRDMSSSNKYKNAKALGDKGFDLIQEADVLRRVKLGLPTIQEERKKKGEEAKKKRLLREKKEREQRDELKRKRKEKEEQKAKEEQAKKEKKQAKKKTKKPGNKDPLRAMFS